MRAKFVLVVIGQLTINLAFAQDSLKTKTLSEVVVTGTRYEVPVEKSGKTITKISSKELEQQAGRSVADVLNTVPNLQIDGVSGTPGTNLGYYARGSRNRQSVILVDGIPMVDPSGISPEYDLRLLSLNQVDNIEVMRGGLSTLYGSGAAASVINIALKKPTVDGVHGVFDINAGSFKSFAQNVTFSGKEKKIYYTVLANNTRSEGFSSADDENAATTFDKDGFSRQNGLVKIGFTPTSKIDLQLFGGLDKFKADYDDGAYMDADNQQLSEQWRAGFKGSVLHNRGQFQLTAQQTWLDKEFKSSFPSHYTGRTTFVEASENIQLSSIITLVGGVSLQRLSYEEKSTDETHFGIVDPYASVVFDLPIGLNVQAGARVNNHSEYGSHLIYNVNPSYLISLNESFKIKVLGSLSTSFVTPSLYQLFSSYGNEDLQPEEALNVEGGSTLYIKNFQISLVYFDRNETDAIGFRSLYDDEGNWIGGEYYNLNSERKVKGFEAEARYAFNDRFSLSGSYSYATTKDMTTFYRIPKNKIGVAAQSALWRGSNVSVRYQFTGERQDMDYAVFEEVTMDSYQLVDVVLSQNLFNDDLVVYGSVNNILGEEYVWAPGFSSMPRNFTAGVKFKF